MLKQRIITALVLLLILLPALCFMEGIVGKGKEMC